MTPKLIRNFLLIVFLFAIYALMPKVSIKNVQARECCEALDCNGNFTSCVWGGANSCIGLFPDGNGPAYMACLAQCHAEEVACANRPCEVCTPPPDPSFCGPYSLFCAPYSPGTNYFSGGCHSDSDCPNSFCGADGGCYGNMNKQCFSDNDCPNGMFCYGGTNTCIQFTGP
jgi:hypothetical protein